MGVRKNGYLCERKKKREDLSRRERETENQTAENDWIKRNYCLRLLNKIVTVTFNSHRIDEYSMLTAPICSRTVFGNDMVRVSRFLENPTAF